MGIPDSGQLSFTALRNRSKLGTHLVTFSRRDNAITVDVDIDYAVKIGFVTVFRYRLRGREDWDDGRLLSARAQTTINGATEFMRARREGDVLMVEGSRVTRYQAPAGTMVASHWNKAQLGCPMINPQNGTLLRFTVTPRGAAAVADSAGTLHPAQRFALTGTDPIDLWYDSQGIWIALQATIRDGSTVTYLRNV